MKNSRVMTFTILSLILLVLLQGACAAAWSPAAVSIAASNSTSVALLDDGTVWQWGYVHEGIAWRSPQQVDIPVVRKIAAGSGHVLALKSDGTVWAWGSNKYGQLGDGTYNDSVEPVRAEGLSGVTAIAAGRDFSLALKGDGTVWAWGSNSYGQVGEGSLNFAGSTVPVMVKGLNDIKAISAGGSRCFALQGDGTVWAWGENRHGILGDGTNESRYTPIKSKVNNVKAFDAGDGSHALAIREDGNVWAWGYDYNGQLGTGGTSLSDLGRLSFGPEADVYNPDIIRGLSDAKSVTAGGSHSAALGADGIVWAWGSNSDGQIGQGTQGGSDVTSPVQVKGLDGVVAVDAGMYHTLALRNDGSVWAWGSNSDGQIGNDSASPTSPVLVLMSSQIPPSPTPTPIIVSTTPTAVPESGTNDMLAVVAIAAACLVLSKRGQKKP